MIRIRIVVFLKKELIDPYYRLPQRKNGPGADMPVKQRPEGTAALFPHAQCSGSFSHTILSARVLIYLPGPLPRYLSTL